MRRERTDDIIRKRVNAMWNELVMAKEVTRALTEALQDQMTRNRILEDMIAGMNKE